MHQLSIAILADRRCWRRCTGWPTGPCPRHPGRSRQPSAAKATVVRDALGVPHIRAANQDDAIFLQGYVTAQDRLWQMDALRRLAAGDLSEMVGAAALEADRESRTLRMRRAAEAHLETMPPARPRRARGVCPGRERLYRIPPGPPAAGVHAAALRPASLERSGFDSRRSADVPQPDHDLYRRDREAVAAGGRRSRPR